MTKEMFPILCTPEKRPSLSGITTHRKKRHIYKSSASSNFKFEGCRFARKILFDDFELSQTVHINVRHLTTKSVAKEFKSNSRLEMLR